MSDIYQGFVFVFLLEILKQQKVAVLDKESQTLIYSERAMMFRRDSRSSKQKTQQET